MNSDLLGVISFTLLLVGLCYGVGRLCFAAGRLTRINILHHAAAPVIGLSVLAFQLWLYGLIHLPWNGWLLLAPWILLGAIVRSSFVKPLRHLPVSCRNFWKRLKEVDRLSKVLITFGIICAFVFLLRLALEPLISSDTMAFWSLKAKEFFYHHAVYVDPYLHSSYGVGQFYHVDYPPLWPLMADVSYALLGHVQEALQKTSTWIFCVSGVVAIWAFAKERLGDSSKATILAFVMLAAPQFLPNLLIGQNMAYADYPLAVTMLFSALFLMKSLDTRRPDNNWLFALLFASIASVIKNEGVAFLVIVGSILVIRYILYVYAARHERRIWYNTVIALTILAAVLLPQGLWFLYKRSHHLEIEFKPSNLAASGMGVHERLVIIGKATADYLKVHPLYWWQAAALALGILAAIRRSSRTIIVMLALILGMLASYLFSFMFSAHELHYHVATSIDRLLNQILPLMLVLLIVIIEERRPDKAR